MAAEDTQIGGNHYAIKYLARCDDKGGLEDLQCAPVGKGLNPSRFCLLTIEVCGPSEANVASPSEQSERHHPASTGDTGYELQICTEAAKQPFNKMDLELLAA